MRIIRHILSHLLLITLLTGICTVYIFRHQVLPERYVQQLEHYAQAIHPALATIAYNESAKQESVQQDEIAQSTREFDVIYVDGVPLVDESKSQQVERKMELVSKDSGSSSSESQGQKEVIPESGQEQVSKEESIETETGHETKTETVVARIEEKTEEAEKPAEVTGQKPGNKEVEVASSDIETAEYLTVLRDARIAFGQGKMKLAVEKYNELIELENDEADFHGELGNVYYAMGKWNEAGVSYYEAAVRLIKNGQLDQVRYLQRVIQGLDAERAEKLAKQMSSSK